MKLIVLIVVSIAVFMANCREPPVSRELSNDDVNLSDYRNLPGDHNLSDGRDLSYVYGRDLFDGDDLTYGSDLPDGANNETSTTEPESFTGDPIYPVFTTDVDEGFPIIELGPGNVQGGLENYVSSLIDRKLKEEGSVQNERKLQGGSKCKSDIVCSLLGGSCVSNSTYCSGREVPSVCSGAKCKCCITVNLEVKVHDLETELRAMIVNLTSANSNLNTKLDSVMNFMISANSSQATVNSNMDLKIDSIMSTNSNLTKANSNLDLKIDTIISTNSNLTIENSNMDLKIDSIISTNSNLTKANSNLDLKIDTIMSTNANLTIENSNMDLKIDSIMSTNSNLTIANSKMDLKIDSLMSTNSNLTIATSDMKNELEMIKNDSTNANANQNTKLNSIISSNSNLRNNLTNANANQNLKLDSIMEHQGCPEGSLLFTPSNQCFRVLKDVTRTWIDGKAACSELGLVLAQPYEPVLLQSYLTTKYGLTNACWIDGRGDGSNVRWQRNGQAIINPSSPLWHSGYPYGGPTTNHCLGFLTHPSWISRKQVYYSGWTCSSSKIWTLCESGHQI